MKKLLCIITAVMLLAFPVLAEETTEPLVTGDAVTLSSPCAILIERSTGTVIFEKNAHERGAPASVTKVMTLLLIAEAIDSGTINFDTLITGSSHAASMGGSQVWLKEGEQMPVSEMLKCIAVVSANDCAVAMAEHLAGSEPAFVQRMNERAEELGLQDTHFTSCTGLFDDDDHYTTAYDIAVMSCELLQHEWIKEYTTIWTDTVRDGAFGLSNTNKLVRYYEGCTGLKTGYTARAMYCLSASAMRDGVEFIAVIMHGESIEKRNEDAKALLSFGFANYAICPLRSPDALPPMLVELGEKDSVQPVYTGEPGLLMKKSEVQDISYSLDLPASLPAPIEEGQQIGTLTVLSGEKELAQVPLLADSSVGRLGAWGVFQLLLKICLSSS